MHLSRSLNPREFARALQCYGAQIVLIIQRQGIKSLALTQPPVAFMQRERESSHEGISVPRRTLLIVERSTLTSLATCSSLRPRHSIHSLVFMERTMLNKNVRQAHEMVLTMACMPAHVLQEINEAMATSTTIEVNTEAASAVSIAAFIEGAQIALFLVSVFITSPPAVLAMTDPIKPAITKLEWARAEYREASRRHAIIADKLKVAAEMVRARLEAERLEAEEK